MSTRPWLTVWCDVCMCWDSVGGGGPTEAEAEARAAAVGWLFTGKGSKRKASCPEHNGGSFCPHDGTGVRPHHGTMVRVDTSTPSR